MKYQVKGCTCEGKLYPTFEKPDHGFCLCENHVIELVEALQEDEDFPDEKE